MRQFVVAASLLLTSGVPADTPAPDGDRFALATDGATSGREVAVSFNATGSSILSWINTVLPDRGVYVRRFDPDGSSLGNQLRLSNDQSTGGTGIALDPQGNYLAAWDELDNGWDIWARARDVGVIGLPAPAFPVVVIAGQQLRPDADSGPDDTYVVAWADGASNIAARLFATDGTALTDEIPVSAEPGDNTRVAMDSQGNFVVSWWSFIDTVRARRFDVDGVALTEEIQVNVDPLQGDPTYSDVTIGGDGTIIIVFEDGGSFQTDVITGRRFDANLNPLGDPFTVNTAPPFTWPHVGVASDADGGFVVVWGAKGPVPSRQVWGRRYLPSGEPDSDPFRISQVDLSHVNPDVGMDDLGNFTVGWQEQNSGEALGATARRYCGDLKVEPPADRVACVGLGAEFEVASKGVSPFTYQWSKDGIPLMDNGSVSGSDTPLLMLGDLSSGDAGSYACRVEDSCGTVQVREPAGLLEIAMDPPDAVGDSLLLGRRGHDLVFTWQDVPLADTYAVFEDMDPRGAFATETGSAVSGSDGLVVPWPGGDFVQFLVAAGNGCGAGPKR